MVNVLSECHYLYSPWMMTSMWSLGTTQLIVSSLWITLCAYGTNTSEGLSDRLEEASSTSSYQLRFLRYFQEFESRSSGQLHGLLQGLHSQFFPHLNFVLLGQPSFVLNTLARVDVHDSVSARTTDYRHYSRWIVVTLVDGGLLAKIKHVAGNLENLVVMSPKWCFGKEEMASEKLSISVLTLSRSRSPPDFVQAVLPPSSTRHSIKGVFPNIQYGFNNRTLLISSLMYKPFTMRREANGSVVYEGYCFELLDVLARALNFSFELTEPDDGEWGLLREGSDTWTGLIGQLQKREVDMVVAPLTIHEDREEVMDFLLPAFHVENVDVLYKALNVGEEDPYMIITPFRLTVFVCITIAVVCVVIILFLLERYTPRPLKVPGAQKTDSQQTKKTSSVTFGQPASLYKQLTDSECFAKKHFEHFQLIFWKILGTLFKQGGQWEPVTYTGRVLMACWWLMTLSIAAAYSAYLVASLAVQKQPKPFQTLQDVVDSTTYKVGIMSTGIIKLIFEERHAVYLLVVINRECHELAPIYDTKITGIGVYHYRREHLRHHCPLSLVHGMILVLPSVVQKSNQTDFQAAWAKILQENTSDPGVLAGTEHEHLQKVVEGKYCWIVDVTTAQKAMGSHCSLETVGLRLNGQQLALAVPTNSTLKPAIEGAMSAIADSGLLDMWWRRWQKVRNPEMCPMPPDVTSIRVRDLIGPAYLAVAGITAALLLLIAENYIHECVIKPSMQSGVR